LKLQRAANFAILHVCLLLILVAAPHSKGQVKVTVVQMASKVRNKEKFIGYVYCEFMS